MSPYFHARWYVDADGLLQRRTPTDQQRMEDLLTASGAVHDLKTWWPYFAEVLDGRKPFEIRRDDRGFAVGDTLRLREWMPATRTYTGRECQRTVTCITRGWGLPVGTVVLGLAEPAANQRAVEVETATREHFGRAYAPPGGPIDGITKLAQASFRAGYVIGRAASLASPAPAPPAEEPSGG